MIDTIQLVWTHSCEHGVLRGVALHLDDSSRNEDTNNLIVVMDEQYESVEFGPEQLVARVSASWINEQRGVLQVPMHVLGDYSLS
jgi:hypothetical protein